METFLRILRYICSFRKTGHYFVTKLKLSSEFLENSEKQEENSFSKVNALRFCTSTCFTGKIGLEKSLTPAKVVVSSMVCETGRRFENHICEHLQPYSLDE